MIHHRPSRTRGSIGGEDLSRVVRGRRRTAHASGGADSRLVRVRSDISR